MKIRTTYSQGVLTVFMHGELDHHCAAAVVQSISESMDTSLPRETIIDMSALSFMDSSGIAVLIKAKRRAELCGSKIAVINPGKQPLKVLDASGIDRIIPIFERGGVTT